MKRLSLNLALALALLCGGCSLLMPKRVELFQDKVAKMPTISSRELETQKQTAALADKKVNEALLAAVRTQASAEVIVPTQEASKLTGALSLSLGPPASPWFGETDALAAKLTRDVARLDARLESFRKDNDENAGKKIEGTGLFQVPYFAFVGIFVVLAVIAWHVIKMVLGALSIANPGAAVGLGVMNVTGNTAGRLATQVIKGGKDFLGWVGSTVEDPALRDKITEAFKSAQKQAQDEDVKTVVKQLIK